MGRSTAADVALRAGVSRTAVSFVLNNTPGKSISEETRQRVLRAAAELGYQPNQRARSRALVRHYSLGLFISHTLCLLSDAYIIRLTEGLAQVLNKHRFKLVLQPLRLEQSNYLELARQDNVDGIILLNVHDKDRGLAEVVEADFPLVVIGTLADPSIPQVDIDNRKAARSAGQYLVSCGHREIGMIVQAPLAYYAAQERLAGYRQALEENGLAHRPQWVRRADFSEESGYRAMEELLMLDHRPSAVFAGNDMIAYGAMKAIKEAGLSIPRDISLVGFDDDFLSRYLNPPLTTVSLPVAGLGAKAAELMIQRFKGKLPWPRERIVLPTLLTERGSCRRLDG